MKTTQLLSVLGLAGVFISPLVAQQVPAPQKPSDVTQAAAGVEMQPEYVKTLGRFAYVWG